LKDNEFVSANRAGGLVVVMLSNHFLEEVGVRKKSMETQQWGHTSRSGLEIKMEEVQ